MNPEYKLCDKPWYQLSGHVISRTVTADHASPKNLVVPGGILSAQDAALIAAAPDMLQALKYLIQEVKLGKLNIRKDFSLINAHANAMKAVHRAEGTR